MAFSCPRAPWGTWRRSWRIVAAGMRSSWGIRHTHTCSKQVGFPHWVGFIRDRSPTRPTAPWLWMISRLLSGQMTFITLSRAWSPWRTRTTVVVETLTLGYTQSVGELAHQHGLQLHLDGARIYNAAVALGVNAKDLAGPADSVTFCLSKGLSAPVGSILCGSTDFITRARRIRKQLGGGMRQAGVLAAAGIVALETMVDRLGEDHVRAKRLAQGLATVPGLLLEPGTPYTNMVFLSLGEEISLRAAEAAAQLAQKGVRVGVVSERRFRLVTHYWVDDNGVEDAIAAFRELIGEAMI